ncbi:hypothetical protein FB451DRAFT_1214003 [Mycena latifolia]|nr:hypothetical protein FB451DRAFT_1214003 [Mycena latifolia]
MSNGFPPSLRPTPPFQSLKREVFGRVTQCRTGHGYTGEYYSRFAPSEDVDCPCGEGCKHLLRECPLDQRYILEKVSRVVSLPEIMGKIEGIVALAEFLEKSGAFTKTGEPRRQPSMPTCEDEPEKWDSDDSGDEG